MYKNLMMLIKDGAEQDKCHFAVIWINQSHPVEWFQSVTFLKWQTV